MKFGCLSDEGFDWAAPAADPAEIPLGPAAGVPAEAERGAPPSAPTDAGAEAGVSRAAPADAAAPADGAPGPAEARGAGPGAGARGAEAALSLEGVGNGVGSSFGWVFGVRFCFVHEDRGWVKGTGGFLIGSVIVVIIGVVWLGVVFLHTRLI